MTTIEMNPLVPQPWRPARWVPLLFALASLTLLPWTVMLALTLPARHPAAHWDVTWAGFDTMLALLLGAVAIAALRRSPWLEGVATAAAALLVIDAWFDITTAASRFEVISAVTEAAIVELPVAAFCLVLARDTERVLAWALHSVTTSGRSSSARKQPLPIDAIH